MYLSGLIDHLRELLAGEALDFVFQPIFDLRRREVLGYESLMRGPQDSPLQTPEQLLRVARVAGLDLELERLVTRRALAAFASAGLPGRLFIRLSAAMIVAQAAGDALRDMLAQAGLPPERLVVEHLQHGEDGADGLDTALAAIRSEGIGLAFDAFTAGPAATQPRPDFVKLSSRHTGRIHTDLQRQRAMAHFLGQAAALGVQVVAEGIEDSRELATLHQLGCGHAQGQLLGRAAAEPARQLARSVAGLLLGPRSVGA